MGIYFCIMYTSCISCIYWWLLVYLWLAWRVATERHVCNVWLELTFWEPWWSVRLTTSPHHTLPVLFTIHSL